MGAINSAAAALLMTLDSKVLTMKSPANTRMGGHWLPSPSMASAIRPAPPLDSSDCPTGIIAPSNTTTGPSMAR